MATFVIYSPSECAANDGAGFWDNEAGWTELSEAAVLSLHDRLVMNLPISAEQDAVWLSRDEVTV